MTNTGAPLSPAARDRKLNAAARRVREALALLDAVHDGRDTLTNSPSVAAENQLVARSADQLSGVLSTLHNLTR